MSTIEKTCTLNQKNGLIGFTEDVYGWDKIMHNCFLLKTLYLEITKKIRACVP